MSTSSGDANWHTGVLRFCITAKGEEHIQVSQVLCKENVRKKKRTNELRKKKNPLIEIRFCPLIAHIARIDNSLERCQQMPTSPPKRWQWVRHTRVSMVLGEQSDALRNFTTSQQKYNIFMIISICFSVRQNKKINAIRGITKIKYSSLWQFHHTP